MIDLYPADGSLRPSSTVAVQTAVLVGGMTTVAPRVPS